MNVNDQDNRTINNASAVFSTQRIFEIIPITLSKSISFIKARLLKFW